MSTDDFEKRMRDEITSEEYVRRLRETVRQRYVSNEARARLYTHGASDGFLEATRPKPPRRSFVPFVGPIIFGVVLVVLAIAIPLVLR